jgi:hypothetical protein
MQGQYNPPMGSGNLKMSEFPGINQNFSPSVGINEEMKEPI